jgi:hypothetical protein
MQRVYPQSICPITGWKMSNDRPNTFEYRRAKKEYRKKTYTSKKAAKKD